MPNFTVEYPGRTGNVKYDTERLFEWAALLTDELKIILSGLDEANISEAYTKYIMEGIRNDK